MVCRAEKDRQFAFAVVNIGIFGVFSNQYPRGELSAQCAKQAQKRGQRKRGKFSI
jgi:hypothetical protein